MGSTPEKGSGLCRWGRGGEAEQNHFSRNGGEQSGYGVSSPHYPIQVWIVLVSEVKGVTIMILRLIGLDKEADSAG